MLIYAKEEGAVNLQKAHLLDAGFDLASFKETICKPHLVTMIDTGIHLKLEPDEVAFIQPRSSTSKQGLFVITGTIDAGYTGSLKIQAINLTDSDISISKGQRIAQIIVLTNSRCLQKALLVSLDNFCDTNDFDDNRRNNGFGSSGQ